MNKKLHDFLLCKNNEEIYQTIISYGKRLKPFDPAWKTEENLVVGCQSTMYLHLECEDGVMHFFAFSEALISAGLAALLIEFYDGKTAEWILTNPPHFLAEFNIPATLTPSRVNGLASLYEKMKKLALNTLIASYQERQ